MQMAESAFQPIAKESLARVGLLERQAVWYCFPSLICNPKDGPSELERRMEIGPCRFPSERSGPGRSVGGWAWKGMEGQKELGFCAQA